MAVTSFIRRQFKNGVAVNDELVGGCSAVATTFTAASGTTFPDGSVGDFITTLDQGTPLEERVLCASRSGAIFTVAANGRGYNSTTAVAHAANASILHTMDQQDLDEANQAVVNTIGLIQASGDLLVGASLNTIARLARGSSDQFLQTVGSGLQWTGFGGGESQTVGTSNTDGSQPTPARSDHGHQGVTSFGPSGSPRNGIVLPGNADYLAVASGLTGATAATRYVGATTGGAPVTGGFLLGDFVIDQTGTIWICTTAGSPGIWNAMQVAAQPWQVPSFQNSWQDGGGTNAGFQISGNRVWFQGLINGGASGTVAFTLPSGYRPQSTANTNPDIPLFAINNAGQWVGGCWLAVTGATGTVAVVYGATTNAIWLDGASFSLS